MTIRIPKWLAWVLGALLLAGVIAAAFLVGRSSDDGEPASTSSSSASATSTTSTTTEPEAVPAKCSEKEAMRATLSAGFSDEILAVGHAQFQITSIDGGEFSGPGVDGPFFDDVTGYRPAILECRDLTGDGVEEMIFAPNAGASGAVLNWAIFAPNENGEWTLAFDREAVKIRDVKIRGDVVVETVPTFAEGEPLCCPSGRRSSEFAYEDGEFRVVSPVATRNERLLDVSSGGVQRLGEFKPETESPAAAYSDFGTPTSITNVDVTCEYAWEDLGLTIHFVNFGGADPCGPDGAVGSIDLLGSAASQAGWHTNEGAEIGMSEGELLNLYPGAKTTRGELVLVKRASHRRRQLPAGLERGAGRQRSQGLPHLRRRRRRVSASVESDDRLWSVEFLIEDRERASFDYAGTRVVGPHDYMVVQPAEGQEGPSTVHIDVRASSPEDATANAADLYAEMRQMAELGEAEPRVVTVSRVAGVSAEADRYIIEAEDMLEERRFELAVIAAQIHCEMHIRQAIVGAAATRGDDLHRKHGALGRRPPATRLAELNNPLGSYT